MDNKMSDKISRHRLDCVAISDENQLAASSKTWSLTYTFSSYVISRSQSGMSQNNHVGLSHKDDQMECSNTHDTHVHGRHTTASVMFGKSSTGRCL